MITQINKTPLVYVRVRVRAQPVSKQVPCWGPKENLEAELARPCSQPCHHQA